MWLLNFLPNWIIHLVTLTGTFGLIAATFFKFIPAIKLYRLPVLIVSGIVLLFGVWLEGAKSNEEAWQAKVKELELKVAKAEAESQKENVKLVEKIVVKQQLIKQRGEDIINYVEREIIKYDNTCVIPKEFIKAHNDAAEKLK